MLYDEFEKTFQFLAGYFNEDFSYEYGEPEIAVEDYIRGNDLKTRTAVVNELRQLLAVCPEEDLDGTIFTLGCYYDPQRHRGITAKEWLEQVIAQIEEANKSSQ